MIAAITLFKPLEAAGYNTAATIVGAFGTIGAMFNLGNLVPVWKFDGGQVIRQVFRTRAGQGIASFLLLGGLLFAGNSADSQVRRCWSSARSLHCCQSLQLALASNHTMRLCP